MGCSVLAFASELQHLELMLGTARQVSEVNVVGEIQDPAHLLAAVRNIAPDVLVMHLTECTQAWLDLVSQLHIANAKQGIVVMTDSADNSCIISLLKAGINAIISVSASHEDFEIAVTEAKHDRLYVPPRRRTGG